MVIENLLVENLRVFKAWSFYDKDLVYSLYKQIGLRGHERCAE